MNSFWMNPDLPCQILSISDADWDHSKLETLTGKDLYQVIEEAEKLFSASGIRIASYEEPFEACIDNNGRIVGASVVGNPGQSEEDPRITIRFSVAVAESARRQGIARELIRSIMASYPSDEFSLEAWVINPHMAVLLESLGFESYGEWCQESPFMYRPRRNPTDLVHKYRKNPTVSAEFFRLEYYVGELAKTLPHFEPIHKNLQRFPARFNRDEFINLILENFCPDMDDAKDRQILPYTSELQHSINVESKLLGEQAARNVKKLISAQKSIKSIIYYFIRQFPIDRSLVSFHLDDLIKFLLSFLQKIYSTAASTNIYHAEAVQHVERIYAVMRHVDPYQLDMISLNNLLLRFDITRNQATPLVTSIASTLALEPELASYLTTYLEKCNRLCQELNPFQEGEIYNYKDLHGLRAITYYGGTLDQLFF